MRGFNQAARAYFGKSFKEMSADEYLSLVSMIVGPNVYHVQKYPEKNRMQLERIKRLLNGEYEPKGLMDIYYDK